MARRIRGQLIEALLDTLEDACIGIDRSGRVRFLNQAMRDLFKVEGDVESVKFYDALPINDFTRILSTFVKDSDPTPVEQIVVLPGDQVFVAQVNPVISEENRLQGAVGLLKDMAAVQQLEQGIDQALADINKELLLPLTTIKGYVETLLEGAYSSEEVTRRFLQIINEETNRLARLVMSLEEASGKPASAVSEPTALTPILCNVAAMFESLAAQKNLSLQLQLDEDLPTMDLDAESLTKAVVNLVDNAVKCTGLMGYGKVNIRAAGKDGGISITVQDTGPGIPIDEQEAIFDSFYRVKTGPAAELGGTGLGLSVAREAVEKNGGTLTVTSVPDQGATFEIYLKPK